MTAYTANLKVGDIIGRGHFGTVHVGEDDIHGKVAVKIPRQRPDECNEEWLERRAGLLSEGQNLKKADHKHVVQVHYLVESQNSDDIHLVMEFCSGGSLQKPYESGPLSPARVHKVATDIAHGLCALHDRQMLHRDIKPGNILIDKHGNGKLGDFGLVTDDIILGYAAGAGYSDHLAPEVWDEGQTSIRSDIWALGMTLYRLLHGDDWYRASPAPQHLVRDGGFVDTLKWLPHVSAKWRRVIRSMLNDDRTLRPQDAHKVLNLLAELSSELDWQCSVTPNGREWRRVAGKREILVSLTATDARKFAWIAKSLPIGIGRQMTLAGSAKPAGWITIERELRGYFSKSR